MHAPCGWWSWNGAGRVTGGLVFGTLLGPEATGPWHRSFGRVPLRGVLAGAGVVWDLCFWFPGCTEHTRVCGVCGMGLLFENYIVDASIFYKKQFPRYMNLDLCCCPWVVPFGVRRW